MDFSTPKLIFSQLLNQFQYIQLDGELQKYLQYWPFFLIGAIAALILTPIIGQLALKYDITYKPGTKKNNKDFDNPEKALHEGITPALGGLAITIPTLIVLLLFFKLDSFTIPIILSVLILMIGSTLDDIFNLSARAQIIYQVLAATIIVFSVINLTNLSLFNIPLDLLSLNFSILNIQQSLIFPGDLILFVWILICINAVKWTAGSPGIIEGNSLITFLLIFIISIRSLSVFSSAISLLIVGALFVFLFFALPPQKIMTGSSGKTVYGFLICVLALIADSKMSTTIMLLLVPIIDFAYVIIRRYLTYKPKNFVELMRINDTTHLHHQLLKLNLNRKQVVLIETAITLLIGSLATLSTGAFRYFALIFGSAVAISFIVIINIRASKANDKKQKEGSPESRYSY